jgi:hypothetical protein
MSLNFADKYAVRAVIIPRCTAIVVNYALYLLGLGNGVSANHALWARETMRRPNAIGDEVSWFVLNQPDYENNGSSILDDTLKGIVETAINLHFIPEA